MLSHRWKCLDCDKIFKKEEKDKHVKETEHLINTIPFLHEDNEKVEAAKKPVMPFFKSQFSGKARKDYPKTYEVFDKLRGELNGFTNIK